MEQQAAAAAAAGHHRHKNARKPINQKVVTSIIDGLKQIYFHKVKQLEPWGQCCARSSH